MAVPPATRPRQNLLLLAVMAGAYVFGAVVVGGGDARAVLGDALAQDVLLVVAAVLCFVAAARGREPAVVDATTRTAGAIGVAVFAVLLVLGLAEGVDVGVDIFVLAGLVMAVLISWVIRRPLPRVSSRRADLEARRDHS